MYDGDRVLTGKKQLPVLEAPDQDLLPESGDIIALIEAKTEGALAPKAGRADLDAFFDGEGKFKELQRILTRGRVLEMTHLRDWAKPEDVAYAKKKYEDQGAAAGTSTTL